MPMLPLAVCVLLLLALSTVDLPEPSTTSAQPPDRPMSSGPGSTCCDPVGRSAEAPGIRGFREVPGIRGVPEIAECGPVLSRL